MDELLARVPEELRGRFREIVALTDTFCDARLNDEYRDLCRRCAADACEAAVPVGSGKAAGWAAGVIYSVAYANFLTSDPSQEFHTPPDELAKAVGVSPATMHSKAKAVRDALGIDRLDPHYSTRERNEDNPLNWILSVNGFLTDIRTAPRGAQEEAFRKGLIPYVPADGPPAEPPAPPRRRAKGKGRAKGEQKDKAAGPARIYALDVFLLEGPITEAFAEKNPTVLRTIEIRGDQTLEDLHWAIFDAFDRDDPHMYEFQFGKGPMDPKGPRYVMREAGDDGGGPPVAGYADETTIDDLGLKVGRHFGYWFDFGDDWHHQIDVAAITDGSGKGKYPRVTKREGESPPQYADWDAEE